MFRFPDLKGEAITEKLIHSTITAIDMIALNDTNIMALSKQANSVQILDSRSMYELATY
jgi:hypothetical protein